MKNIIEYLGRLSVVLLIVIFIEGMISSGDAFEFTSYTFFSWFIQSLTLLVCVWITHMWYEESNIDI